MKKRKTLALLLAVSMVFTLNSGVFAKTRAVEVESTAEKVQSVNIQSANIKLVSSDLVYTGKEQTVSIDRVTCEDEELTKGVDYEVVDSSDKGTEVGSYTLTIKGKGKYTGTATKTWAIIEEDTEYFDFSDEKEAKLDSDDIRKAAEKKETIVQLDGVKLTIPKNLLEYMLDTYQADNVKITAESKPESKDSISNNYPIVPTTSKAQVFDISIKSDGKEVEFGDNTIDVSVDIEVDEVSKLGKGKAFAYCVSTDAVDVKLPEYVGNNSNDAAVMDMTLSHLSTYVFTGEIESEGTVNVWFGGNTTTTYKDENTKYGFVVADNGDGTYTGIYDDDYELIKCKFIDNDAVTGVSMNKTANASGGFKVTAPYAVAEGYQAVKWVGILPDSFKYVDRNPQWTADPDLPEVAPGATLQLDSSKYTAKADYDEYYALVVKKLDTVSSTSISENGHIIKIDLNTTPAYTGRKIKASDILEGITLDGKEIDPSLVKIKTKGDKKVGSSVTVTLKRITGLDAVTNKAIAGKELSKVTIRPIEASETALWSKRFYKEGQILVKMKKGEIKKVSAIVPNGWKLNSKKAGVQKGRKINVKKDFTYDSSTGYITFNGSCAHGTIKVSVTTK